MVLMLKLYLIHCSTIDQGGNNKVIQKIRIKERGMKLNTKKISFCLAVMAILGLGGCTDQSAHQAKVVPASNVQAASSAATASKLPANAPTYLVATEASYAPYEFRGASGEIIGFDVDLLTAIGEKQGFKVQFLSRPWDGIFDTLSSGERDIVGAATEITEERKQTMDVSDPYLETRQLAVVKDSAADIKVFEDLKTKTVATQAGTTVDILKALQGSADKVKVTNTQYLAFRDLLAGKVDAAFGEEGVMQYYVTSLPPEYSKEKLRVIPYVRSEKAYLGFYVKKGRTDLLNQINAGLKQVKADGTYQKIHEKWFGKQQLSKTLEQTAAEAASAAK